jgi:hypothetical protein
MFDSRKSSKKIEQVPPLHPRGQKLERVNLGATEFKKAGEEIRRHINLSHPQF